MEVRIHDDEAHLGSGTIGNRDKTERSPRNNFRHQGGTALRTSTLFWATRTTKYAGHGQAGRHLADWNPAKGAHGYSVPSCSAHTDKEEAMKMRYVFVDLTGQ